MQFERCKHVAGLSQNNELAVLLGLTGSGMLFLTKSLKQTNVENINKRKSTLAGFLKGFEVKLKKLENGKIVHYHEAKNAVKEEIYRIGHNIAQSQTRLLKLTQ